MQQILWKDKKSFIKGHQEFKGVPFSILGLKRFDCQFGRDWKEKQKENRKQELRVGFPFFSNYYFS